MPAETPWKTLEGSSLIADRGPAIGHGYMKARYRRTLDGLIFVNLEIQMADDTSYGTPGDGWTWRLPNEFREFLFDVAGVSVHAPSSVGDAIAFGTGGLFHGICYAYQQAAQWFLSCYFGGATLTQVGPTSPFTWKSGDILIATLIAEGFGN